MRSASCSFSRVKLRVFCIESACAEAIAALAASLPDFESERAAMMATASAASDIQTLFFWFSSIRAM